MLSLFCHRPEAARQGPPGWSRRRTSPLAPARRSMTLSPRTAPHSSRGSTSRTARRRRPAGILPLRRRRVAPSRRSIRQQPAGTPIPTVAVAVAGTTWRRPVRGTRRWTLCRQQAPAPLPPPARRSGQCRRGRARGLAVRPRMATRQGVAWTRERPRVELVCCDRQVQSARVVAIAPCPVMPGVAVPGSGVLHVPKGMCNPMYFSVCFC